MPTFSFPNHYIMLLYTPATSYWNRAIQASSSFAHYKRRWFHTVAINDAVTLEHFQKGVACNGSHSLSLHGGYHSSFLDSHFGHCVDLEGIIILMGLATAFCCVISVGNEWPWMHINSE